MLEMQGDGTAGAGERRWRVRGDSRHSRWGLVVLWLWIGAALWLVYAGLNKSDLVTAEVTLALAVVPAVRAGWLWLQARGERFGIDLDAGELVGRWNRWSLAGFRAVELRHVDYASETRLARRKRGWSVVLVAGLDGGGVVVYESARDFRAWRVAEKFARVLALPMIDAAGDSPMTRHSHELDVALLDRLRRMDVAPDPGPPPPGVQQSVDGEVLRITTRVFSGSSMLIAALAGGVFAAPFAVMWPWVFLVLPAVGAVVAVIAVPTGACQLEVDAERVCVAGPILRGRRSVPLAAIEGVRLFGTGAHARVGFVTDAGVVSLPLRAGDFGWLRARLFHWWTGGATQRRDRAAIYR